MKWSVIVRESTIDDIPAIAEIYGRHVIEGTGSFELVAPDNEEMHKRWQAVVNQGLPWLVAEVDGLVIGYAYAGPFRAREAYRFTLEDSIYVKAESSGRGVGRMLLEKLIELCSQAGYKQMLAVIGDSKNLASVRVHERCGFRHVGVLKDVGIKFERWLDVVLMQRELQARSMPVKELGDV